MEEGDKIEGDKPGVCNACGEGREWGDDVDKGADPLNTLGGSKDVDKANISSTLTFDWGDGDEVDKAAEPQIALGGSTDEEKANISSLTFVWDDGDELDRSAEPQNALGESLDEVNRVNASLTTEDEVDKAAEPQNVLGGYVDTVKKAKDVNKVKTSVQVNIQFIVNGPTTPYGQTTSADHLNIGNQGQVSKQVNSPCNLYHFHSVSYRQLEIYYCSFFSFYSQLM